MHEDDLHKTAFQTLDGLMKWAAMPFIMCIAPFPFQLMMNDILCDFLHNFVIVYLDAVCV
jgi:hypothetical protein